jgi:nicotinate-nucleotide adenylyltransferase
VKIGIFGGTFDPPHIGHLIAAQDACDALQLDRLLFVPAAEPPHKRNRSITPAPIRREMLQAALKGETRFQICDLELGRNGPSYTVDTLRELRKSHPEDALFLLIGADQVREFATWRAPEEIAQLAEVVQVARSGLDRADAGSGLVPKTIQITRIDVSATDIRQRVADGRSIRYLVPAAVERLIREHGLYRGHHNAGAAQASRGSS